MVLVGSVSAQEADPQRSCASRNGASSELLQSLVTQYHPEVLAPATRRDSTVVGFVLDSTCRVVRHAAGRIQSPDSSSDLLLARLFPDLKGGPASFSVSGIAETVPFGAPGHPVIVYGVLRRS